MKFFNLPILLPALLLALALPPATAQEKKEESKASDGFREWTSTEGKTLEARFVSFEAGTVILAGRNNGRELRLPTSRLSPADQDYLKIWLPYSGTSWSQVDSFRFEEKKARGYDFAIVPFTDKPVKFDEEYDLYGSPTVILRKVNESLAEGDTADWLLVSYVESSKSLNQQSDEVGMINTRKEQALIVPSPFTGNAHIRKSRTQFRIFVYVADRKTGKPRSNILAIDSMIVRKR